jgi:hypothetical protein
LVYEHTTRSMGSGSTTRKALEGEPPTDKTRLASRRWSRALLAHRFHGLSSSTGCSLVCGLSGLASNGFLSPMGASFVSHYSRGFSRSIEQRKHCHSRHVYSPFAHPVPLGPRRTGCLLLLFTYIIGRVYDLWSTTSSV